MTFILLIIFLYQVFNTILADEESQAEYFEKLFEEFQKSSGIRLD